MHLESTDQDEVKRLSFQSVINWFLHVIPPQDSNMWNACVPFHITTPICANFKELSMHSFVFRFSFMVSKNQLWSTIDCAQLTIQMISSLASLMGRDQSSCFDLIMFYSKNYMCKFKYHDFLYRSSRIANKMFLKKSSLLQFAKYPSVGVCE